MFDVQLTFFWVFSWGGCYLRGVTMKLKMIPPPQPPPLYAYAFCHHVILMRLESDTCLDVYNVQCEDFLS